MADEIKDANVVRLWRDPASGKWCGLLGPDDGRGLLTSKHISPFVVLATLAHHSRMRGWPFDPTAPGPVIDSGAVR
jgi:hypothetical protein